MSTPIPTASARSWPLDWLLERLGKRSQPLSHDRCCPNGGSSRASSGSSRLASRPLGARRRGTPCGGRLRGASGRGAPRRWAERVERVINIDHHVTNPGTGHVNLVRPEAAAPGSCLRLDPGGRRRLDADVATLLYAAIMADTGSFRFSNTTAPRRFEIAADLVRARRAARRDLPGRSTTPAPGVRAPLGPRPARRCSGARTVGWPGSPHAGDDREEGARQDESEGFIQYPRMIDGVEVAIFFRELESGAVRVGFRSRSGGRQPAGPGVRRRRSSPGRRLHPRGAAGGRGGAGGGATVEAAGGGG